MYFHLKTAKNGPGADPMRMPGSLINRVGTALRVGEILMCDFDNQTYDDSAGPTGCLGNGIMPATTSPTGFAGALHTYPIMLVNRIPLGTAGLPVDGIFHGFGDSIQTNSAAVVGTIVSLGAAVNAIGTMNVTNATTATLRLLMLNRSLHTVAVGEENVRGLFCGNSTR